MGGASTTPSGRTSPAGAGRRPNGSPSPADRSRRWTPSPPTPIAVPRPAGRARGGEPVGGRAREDFPGRVRYPVGRHLRRRTGRGRRERAGWSRSCTPGCWSPPTPSGWHADHADRRPARPDSPVARRATDATTGLTVTRLADVERRRSASPAPPTAPGGPGPARSSTSPSSPARCSSPSTARSSASTRSPRPVPRTRRLRQPQRPAPTRHRQSKTICRPPTGSRCRAGTEIDTWSNDMPARRQRGAGGSGPAPPTTDEKKAPPSGRQGPLTRHGCRAATTTVWVRPRGARQQFEQGLRRNLDQPTDPEYRRRPSILLHELVGGRPPDSQHRGCTWQVEDWRKLRFRRRQAFRFIPAVVREGRRIRRHDASFEQVPRMRYSSRPDTPAATAEPSGTGWGPKRTPSSERSAFVSMSRFPREATIGSSPATKARRTLSTPSRSPWPRFHSQIGVAKSTITTTPPNRVERTVSMVRSGRLLV